jgi:hypothetical protein
MSTNENLAKLLEKSIEASNRTTHAIRALVRFLFIQLAFLTAAYLVWQIGLVFPDEDNCNAFACEPFGFVYFIVVGLLITGVIISSRAGWYELSLSDTRSKHAPAGSGGPGSQDNSAENGQSSRP